MPTGARALPGFTGGRIDRADHLRADPAVIADLLRDPRAAILATKGFDALPAGAWLERLPVPSGLLPEQLLFLGLEKGGAPLFAPLARAGARDDGPGRALMAALATVSEGEAALYAMVRSLDAWHARHGFCAVCGAVSQPFRAGWGRRCASCDAEHYPRVDPVVIMLAEHRGADGPCVLLGRQPRFPAGFYSALAGYVEAGESLEEAVVRELAEEAGVRARNVRYLVSQPWPFSGALMLGCIATVDDPALTLDPTELDDARWFSRAQVRAALAGDGQAPFMAPPPLALAHTLIRNWADAPDGAPDDAGA